MIRLILTISFLAIATAANAQSEEVRTDFMWGRIENGQKVGYWQYYDVPGDTSLIVNYNTGKIQYIKRDTAKYLIKYNGIWIESDIATPPHYIGSNQEINDYILRNIGFPVEARIKGIQGITAISFTIDATGNAGNFDIVKQLSGGYTQEAIRVLNGIPNTWIPATIASQAVESKMIIVINFGLGKEYVASKKEKKKYPLLFQKKPYIFNYVIVARGIE